MAENNSSAPLKTALPADDEAFEHFVSACDGAGIQYDGPSYEQGFLAGKIVGMDAAHAVAAQAAPAAVAVPEAINALREAMSVISSINRGAYAQIKVGDDVCYWQRKDWVDWAVKEVLPLIDAALAATPALPATEDSSAGDLAEVQAEAVALQMCSDLKPRTESEKAAYLAGVADGRMYAERDAAKVHAEPVGEGCECANCANGMGDCQSTAPQAQPADALDANMFWNNDDSEEQYSSIEEFLEDEINQGNLNVGDVRTLQRGFRLPNIAVRVTSIDANESEAEYEVIDAAMAAAQEGGNAAKEA